MRDDRRTHRSDRADRRQAARDLRTRDKIISALPVGSLWFRQALAELAALRSSRAAARTTKTSSHVFYSGVLLIDVRRLPSRAARNQFDLQKRRPS
jgi:hypothetical protein